MAEHAQGRDIIVIGGSAGALDPLKTVLAALPTNLAAAVFVVIHISPASPRLLAKILNDTSSLRCDYAEDHQAIESGRVYLAPPDHHLLVKQGQVRVTKGPRENRFRPAIDPLFRTAAHAYGPRVAGVLLSGGLNDGSYGLLVIKQRGGVALVQDPQEAEVPEMVSSALNCVEVDHVLSASRLGNCLAKLTHEALPMPTPAGQPTDNGGEQPSGLPERPAEGSLAPIVCPECGGSLWESQHGALTRYACHEGHAYTAETLLCDQRETVEAALWAAVRTLDENAEMLRRMERKATQNNHRETATTFADHARAQEARASLIRKVIASEEFSKGGKLEKPVPPSSFP